ncbi:MAG: energy-coupling factor ABC transporter ATP-binding protein [Treponema sp.]|jgi:energy-coupling factor transport system ATP-binding protein|nr:energy-coupling factor ABC transporter ATP-binding protein [Treponema sp.]
MELIKFENVSYKYPKSQKTALKGINLSVMEGEFLAVVGANGSGKTTFCKLINGIIPCLYEGQLSGTVTVDGVRTESSSVSALALKVGTVLDDPDAQLFTSTVRGEAAFGPENLLLLPDEIEERVKFALQAAGLTGFEERQPSTLSGGEKQRLAIASALAMKGKILVLDEPFCRLDPQGTEDVIAVLKEIREKHGITIIMTSGKDAKMLESADRVCVLKDGSISALDTAKNIFENSVLLEENSIQPPMNTDINSIFTIQSEEISNKYVNVSNFCFNYDKSGISIENINLSIAENDFIAIIGDNGCGKTTLLKSITGLLRPTSGDIFICGKNTKELSVSDISKYAGFVMQNPDAQLFTDTVYNEVSFALKKMRLSKPEINRRVKDALDVVGLKDADAFPHALSRADRTKTVIACVLAMGCKIIIFDEIDSALDYRDNLRIMNIVRDLHSRGFTIIFVTHNMFLAAQYAQRLIKMTRKGIVFAGRRK